MNSSTVTLTARDGGTFTAFLAMPARPNGGSVVVLQEIFGINANIRSIAERFAEVGYYAIAPDLFWRQEPGVELDPGNPAHYETAMQLMKGMDQQRAVQDSLVAAEHVRALPGSNGRIAAVGYCLGGKLAYLLAMQSGIAAAVSYYGVMIQNALEAAPAIRARLLLHIAQDDHLCPPEAQDAIRTAMAPLADRVEVITYPGVGHAFARRGGQTFRGDAAEHADSLTLALLTKVVANPE
ncbi:dienelactone hydrolase family protein [Sphingobium subterraneum]|uniref:Carboxymethylenebutenolidase n=1 Tax=Sphingobium subterraneum TaxID=627688 RepID=A0A841IVZ4_9SPHN|nr:dienelactone hydrolase family protein [Sphingobium subterraneum]MBB6123089.1 carboxymethylenebutenolidase [Sphingobium subterraneum]